MQVELKKVEGKGFPRKGAGERQGSRKFGVIRNSLGEWVVKWWKGEWKIVGTRWNTAVATSLTRYAMVTAIDRGREVKEVERYTNFVDFSSRLSSIVGAAKAWQIIDWIRS